MSQAPEKVIEFIQEFESWQIRKLEIIEEQDTLIQKLSKDFEIEGKMRRKKIENLKEKEKLMTERLNKIKEAGDTKKEVCETFGKYMIEDDTHVSQQLTHINNQLRKVYEKTYQLGNPKAPLNRSKLNEKTSIDLLKDIERRTFHLLDQIDCLPQQPVQTKFQEIKKRKSIAESRQWYTEQEKERLEKLQKLKEKALQPVATRHGKPLMPMTMLRTQEKQEELKNRKRREFERTYFNSESNSSGEYF